MSPRLVARPPFRPFSRPFSRRPAFTLAPISLAVGLLGATPAAWTAPTGAQLVSGQATVKVGAPGQTEITQTTARAALDWTSFSIAAGERVNISQPGASSVLLNRVLGNDPSLIYGTLSANGNVWLINPRGIVFGAGSRVDVGGLVASTLGISREDLASGRLQLGRGAGDAGELRAEGQISATDGSVVLVAPQLVQSGRIQARRIGLAAATDVLVDVEGDGLVFFNVRNDSLNSRLSVLGRLQADAGTVDLRAAARAGFADTVLNLEGVVQARSLGLRNGRIVVDGGSDGITRVAGTLDATSAAAQGGSVLVQGDKILLDRSALLDASGAAGGGSVRVGGGFQGSDADVRNASMLIALPGARLAANATEQGNGGTVVLWSDQATRFHGSADARGGARGGDGGLVEVSGRDYLEYRGTSDRSAPRGRTGTLLLDPLTLVIQDTDPDLDGDGTPNEPGDDLAGATLAFNSPTAVTNSVITSGAVVTQLLGGNVSLQAKDTIQITGTGIASTSNRNLELRAGGNITINAPISVTGSLTISVNDQAGQANSDNSAKAIVMQPLSASGTLTITNHVDDDGTANGVHDIRANLSAGTLTVLGDVAITGSSRWTLTNTFTFDNIITGNAASTLTKAGAGVLTLSGASGFLGTLDVNAGGVTLGGALGAANVTVSGGTLTLGADNQLSASADVLVSSGTLGVNTRNTAMNSLSMQGGSVTGTSGVITVTDPYDLQAGSVGTILAGAVAANKTGTGTVTLSRANTYSGGTSVTAGTLHLTNADALGDPAANTAVSSGGTLEIDGVNIGNTRALSVGGNGAAGVGALVGTNTAAAGGAITLTADTRIGGTGALTLAGTLSDGASSFALTKVGAGSVALGSAADWNGGTTVSAGTLTLNAVNAVAGALVLSGGTLAIGANDQSLASVSLQGGTVSGSTGVLTSAADFDVQSGTANAILGGAVALNKTTTGTATLGRTNTYGGATSVSDGTLTLGAAGAIGGALTVSGGTLDIGANDQSVASVQLLGGAVSGSTGTLTSAADFDVQSGSISARLAGATVALNKTTAGTVTLGGANSYGGGTAISGGTLALGADNVLPGTGTLTISTGGTLALGTRSDSVGTVSLQGGNITGSSGVLSSTSSFNLESGTVGAVLGGAAAVLNKSTAGTVTLSAANTYGGGTNVSAGTLDLGSGGTLPTSGTVTVSAGTLDIAASSGSVGGVVLQGGSITGSSGTLSTGTTFDVQSGSITAALGGAGALNKSTGGSVTLGGANTYSGGTSVSAGTLTLGADNVLPNTGTVTVSGGTLAVGTRTDTVGGLSLQSGSITGSGTLTSTSAIDARSGNASVVLAGAVALNKTTGGNVTLSGANSYSGGTGISAGTLTLGADNVLPDTGTLTIATGATLAMGTQADSVAQLALQGGTITGSGTLTATGSFNLQSGTIDVVLAGAAAVLNKSTAGGVTLNGANSYGGGTNVSAGTLTLGGGALPGTGTVTVTAGTLDIDATSNSVGGVVLQGGSITGSSGTLTSATAFDVRSGSISAALDGAVALNKTTAGSVTLSGANSYSGGTNVSAGTLALGTAAALPGTGTLTVSGGSFDIGATAASAAGVTLLGGSITGSTGTLASASTFDLQAGSVSARLAGSVGITKTGTGTVVLSGDNLYTGATLVSAGTLGAGHAAALGSTAADTTVAAGATLDVATGITLGGEALHINGSGFGGAGALTGSGSAAVGGTVTLHSDSAVGGTLALDGALQQSGGSWQLGKVGSGTVTLNAASSHGGGTVVSAGTLALGVDNALTGTLRVDSGATLAIGTQVVTLNGVSLQGGSITGSTGVLTSTAAYDIQSGSASAVLAGSVALNKTTAGSATLSGANTYTGGTNVSAGTLALGASNVLPDAGSVVVNGGTLDINTRSDTVAALQLLSGSVTGSSGVLSSTAAFDVQGGSISAVLGGTSALVKTGAGTTTLSGTNSYSGGTTVSAGTLALGASDVLPDTGTVVVNGGTLDIGTRSDTVGALQLLSGSISGTSGVLSSSSAFDVQAGSIGAVLGGSVALNKSGAGTVTLSGANTYSGGTDVSAGTLALGASNVLPDTGTVTVVGVLDIGTRSDTVGGVSLQGGSITGSTGVLTSSTAFDVRAGSMAAHLGGTAGLTKTTTGTVTLSGANSYTGTTTVSAGTLVLAGSDLLADAGTLSVAGGATATLNGTDTVAALLLSGTLDGSGTLTAASYTLSGGTVSAALGAGALSSSGTSQINRSVAAADVSVTGGTLTLADTTLLNPSATVGVGSGAFLTIAGNGPIGTLNLQGTVQGSGVLSAGTYNLDGGTVNATLGAGTLNSQGASTLNAAAGAGTVNVTGGTLELAAAERLSDSANVTVGGPATLQLSGAETVGSLTLAGTLAGSGHTLTTTTTTLQAGAAVNANLAGPTLNVAAGVGNATLSGSAGATSVNVTTGTLTLAAAERLNDAATVTVASGAGLVLQGNETVGTLSLSGALSGASPLKLTAANYLLHAGASVGAMLGAGTLVADGDATLSATADAATLQLDAGVLQLAAADLLNHSADVTVASGATLRLNGDTTIAALLLSGTADGTGMLNAASYLISGGTYALNLGSGNLTFSGSSLLSGQSAAAQVTVISGTLTLASAGRFTAAPVVTVNASGTIELHGDETFGTLAGAGHVNLGSATLSTGARGSTTFSGDLYGSGGLVKLGSSTFTLSGSNTYTGATTVQAGTLAVAGTLASQALQVNSGAALVLAAPDLLADTATLHVAAGALATLGGNDAIGALELLGELNGSGALGAATYLLDGGNVGANVQLGAGALTSTGSSTLAGTAAVTSVAVNGGTLTLAAADRLNAAAATSVAAGATLALNGDQTLGSLSGAGTVTLGSFKLSTGAAGDSTFSGTLSGTGGQLVKQGSSHFTLSGSNSYTGATLVDAGTLTLGAADVLSNTTAVTVSPLATLALNHTDTVASLALAGTLAGSGTLTAATYALDGATVNANLGAGALTSRGSSTLNGSAAAADVVVSTGTLTLAGSDRLADGAAVSVAAPATLAVNGNDTVTSLALAGTLSGSGTLSATQYALDGGTVTSHLGAGVLTSLGASTLSGTAAAASVAVNGGTLTLASANALTSAPDTTVAGGATLVLSADQAMGRLSGSGTVALGTFTLTTGAGGDSGFAGVLAGNGGLTKVGSSTFTLSGANSYGGATTVQAGTLATAAADVLPNGSAVTVASGATLALGGNDTVASLALSGLLSGSHTLTAATYALADGTADAHLGTGALTSTGTSQLNGTSAASTVDVNGGTLTLGAADRLDDAASVSVATGATLLLNGDDRVGSMAVSGTVGGTGLMSASSYVLTGGKYNLDLGGGTLVSSGNSLLNGSSAATTVQVTAGTLTLGSANRLLATPEVSVNSGATLVLRGNETIGSLAGAGSVDIGSATLATGSGGDSTFSGALTGTGTLLKQGSSNFTLSGTNPFSGTTQLAGGTLTLSGTLASQLLLLDAGALALSGAERLSDSAVVNVAAPATFTLTGNETIGALTLQGLLSGSGTLTAASYALAGGTVNADLGSGALTSNGSSRLNGSAAADTVNVVGGTLTLGAAQRLTAAPAVTVASGATLALGGDEQAASLALLGTLSGNGTLGAASYALDGGTVNANLGAGALSSRGSSVLAGTAAATSLAVDAGTLTLAAAARLSALPTTTVAGGAALVLGGAQALGWLAGAGQVDLASFTLSTGAGGNSRFAGVLSGSGGLAKQGSSTFTLAGSNSYTGSTRVLAGTLALEAAERLADSSTLQVSSGASLVLAGNESVAALTLAGTLGGSGTLSAASYTLDGATVNTELGSGTLTSQGSTTLNARAGASTVEVSGGTLALVSAGRLAGTPAVTVAAGAALTLGGDETLATLSGAGSVALDRFTLATGSGGDSSFAGALSGSGSLVKQGSGSFTLAGNSSHSGLVQIDAGTLVVAGTLAAATLQVNAGTLALAAADRLNDSAALRVAPGATATLAGNDSIGSLALQGTLSGSGTLTAASYTLDGGTALANLGAGALTSSGSSLLAGTSAASTVAVNGGTLVLGAADRLADGAAVTVASGAALNLAGNDTVGTLALQGTVAGSGTLSAASYTLQGGTASADLGAGTLSTRGNSTISGTSAATSVAVLDGTLTLGATQRLTALPPVNISDAATLAINGDQAFGSLAGAGSMSLGSFVLRTGTLGDSTFAGVISGSGGLVKQGATIFTLAGANSYTGSTAVEAGTLRVGDGATAGTLASSAYVVNGTLAFAHSDNLTLAQPVSGSGGITQDGSGRLSFSGSNKTYTGATRVSQGELATAGADNLPDGSAVLVAASARLTLAGSETLGALDADGSISLGGSLTAPAGDLLMRGAVTVAGNQAITLSGLKIDAVNDGNRWGSSLALSAADRITLSSGRENGTLRALTLGALNAGNGGRIDAGLLTLTGAATLTGGTLQLSSAAEQTVLLPDETLTGKQSTGLPLAFAADAVLQADTSRISVAAGAGLQISVANGGSVNLMRPDNSFLGNLSVVSGSATAPWAPNPRSGPTAGGGSTTYAVQNRVRIDGGTVTVGGDGIIADLVSIRADRLATAGPAAAIVARMPFDSTVGTTASLPALTLELTPAAFTLGNPFGAPGADGGIRVNIGSQAWGGRTIALDAGYITVLPRGGAQGSTAVLLSGPPVTGSGYRFYFDGAGVQTEIPVFYNGVLPTTPAVENSISATVSVSEGARKERFEEAVRTENVAVRLRAGVIAEVGPAPSATVGTEGVRPPQSCPPAGNALACAAAAPAPAPAPARAAP